MREQNLVRSLWRRSTPVMPAAKLAEREFSARDATEPTLAS